MAKGPDAFRTISEAADEVGVAPHVLRFWETRFSVIRPMKRAGGRRFYRPQDVALLKSLRVLLHDRGLSIREVQQLARVEGVRALVSRAESGPESVPEQVPAASVIVPEPAHLVAAPSPAPAPSGPDDEGLRRLAAARDDLIAVKRRLDALLST
ncbi:MerR family transcriptional regulator [Phenylobacterium parvum]|uniref:MerR family transcriptional regulator n=1 Tax=Phenylobacterium parvum TaxID=2201350 RepID=A0A2Z3HW13_9CAUL|nr:MerR family transcriptional regulator [Phenylobacterium parvum]AWM77410.1 MerR family transcriptional regulator [Phenylobacterium parvum]